MSAARYSGVYAIDDRTDGMMLRFIFDGSRDEMSRIFEAIEKSEVYDFYQYQRVRSVPSYSIVPAYSFFVDVLVPYNFDTDKVLKDADRFALRLTA